MKTIHSNPGRQRGAVLIISLILLMIMTILAVTLSQTSTLQQRMAGNARDADAAFQASEAGLRAGEVGIQNASDNKLTVQCADWSMCTTNSRDAYAAVDFSTTNDSWWNSNAAEYGAAGTPDLTHVANDPLYVVAIRDVVTDSMTIDAPGGSRVYYEVTSFANGNTDTANAVTQSVYGKWALH